MPGDKPRRIEFGSRGKDPGRSGRDILDFSARQRAGIQKALGDKGAELEPLITEAAVEKGVPLNDVAKGIADLRGVGVEGDTAGELAERWIKATDRKGTSLNDLVADVAQLKKEAGLSAHEAAKLLGQWIEAPGGKGASFDDLRTVLVKLKAASPGTSEAISIIDPWIKNGVDLKSVRILLEKQVSLDFIHARVYDKDIGDIAKFVESGVNADAAAKLTRHGISPTDKLLPLLQEGVEPESVLGVASQLRQQGMLPDRAADQIAENIREMMRDSNEGFPLSRKNAIHILNGPPDTYPQVARKGGAGADVRFILCGTDEVKVVREVKCVTSQNNFPGEIRKSLGQGEQFPGARKEVFVQAEIDTPVEAQQWIKSAKANREASGTLSNYNKLYITMANERGDILLKDRTLLDQPGKE